MQAIRTLLLAALLSPAGLGCNASPCPAPDVLVSSGSGTFVGSVGPGAGEAGAGGAELAQSFAATVGLAAFDPSVANSNHDSDSPYYCGPQAFAVAILGVCTLTADVGEVLYDTGNDSTGSFVSASATIRSGQSCTLPSPGGRGATTTLVVGSGTLSLVPGSLTVTLSGKADGVYSTFEFTGTQPSALTS